MRVSIAKNCFHLTFPLSRKCRRIAWFWRCLSFWTHSNRRWTRTVTSQAKGRRRIARPRRPAPCVSLQARRPMAKPGTKEHCFARSSGPHKSSSIASLPVQSLCKLSPRGDQRCPLAERCHVFEVPMASCQVIEHRAWTVRCDSSQAHTSTFLADVAEAVQYGPRQDQPAHCHWTVTKWPRNTSFFLHDYTLLLNVSMLERIYDKHVTINARNIAKYLYFFCFMRIISRTYKMSF